MGQRLKFIVGVLTHDNHFLIFGITVVCARCLRCYGSSLWDESYLVFLCTECGSTCLSDRTSSALFPVLVAIILSVL